MAHVHVILTESLRGVGTVGEVVRVSAGYARNYLIPRGYAEHATESNQRRLSRQLRAKKIADAQQIEDAEALKEQIDGLTLQVVRSAGETGRLFGSVTANDIAEALKERGHPFDRRQVILQQPIREVGEYAIEIQLHPQVTAPIPLTILSTSELRGEGRGEAQETEAEEEAAPREDPSVSTQVLAEKGDLVVPPVKDLHYMELPDALAEADKYLDDARLTDMNEVMIIHGKGQEGNLRQALHESLQNHPNVDQFRIGTEEEGGDGVTIVALKK